MGIGQVHFFVSGGQYQAMLVMNKGFMTWLSFFLRDAAGSPERVG